MNFDLGSILGGIFLGGISTLFIVYFTLKQKNMQKI